MKLVFVSSTFKDMQFERDMLQTYAIPTLNEQLREYGEKAYFGDLRWGVNTTDLDSDEGSRKVLKVCLDQIDNCKPYMIVLIGERYGWIPAQELIDEACVLKGIEKIKDISVTELEIDYGALLNPEYEGRILFYFRNLDKSGMTDVERRDYEAESEIHLNKVNELKKRIGEIYPDQIRYYDAIWDAKNKRVVGLENFLSQVEADLSKVLLRDLEAESNTPWQERSMQAAQRYFEEINKTIAAVDNYDFAYCGSEVTEDRMFIYVNGEEGSGKSTSVISSYCKWKGEKLAYSFGLDKFSSDFLSFPEILIYKLEDILGLEHRVYTDEDLYAEILSMLSKLEEPIGIFIDNADRELLQNMAFLETTWRSSEENMEFKAVFVIAMQRELPFYPFFEFSNKALMRGLTKEESKLVLDSIVRSNHKEISEVVKECILSKESSCYSSYLKSIIKRLLILDSEDFATIRAMGDGMDNINKYMISIVDNTTDERYEILGELMEEAGERINHVFVERIIGLFTHVPVSFSIEDIRGIFAEYNWDFNDLEFSLVVQMLEDVLSYNPYHRFYKIKNRAIEQSISRYVNDWDAIPAAEYMLQNEELRPYAFKSAILDSSPEYLVSVLRRSKIEDITDSICYLLIRGYYQKAIDLLLAIGKNEEFYNVRLLPSFYDVDADSESLVYDFYSPLAIACDECLTKDSKLLFIIEIKALIELVECLIDIKPKNAFILLTNTLDLFQKNEMEFDENLANKIYFCLLKAVNKTKSIAFFEQYIKGEEFLDVFSYDSEYENIFLRMKVYTEFSEIVSLFDDELGEKYHDMAYDIAYESDIFEAKKEDFMYISKLMEDDYWIMIGKQEYPFDLDLLRAEIQVNLDVKEVDNEDLMHKAEEVWKRTSHRSDGIMFWRALLFYFADLSDKEEELDENLVDWYITITKYLVEWGLDVSDYVDILHCAYVLQYIDDIERLLEAAKCDGELETIVQDIIRYYYIEEDMDKFLEIVEKFNTIKDQYMGLERIASISIEAYCEILKEEIENG